MNSVYIVGKMNKEPKVYRSPKWGKVARFNIASVDNSIDEKGENEALRGCHRAVAWGKALKEIEALMKIGASICIEGRLVNRFFRHKSGQPMMVSEIEVRSVDRA
jgi:single stranded DNA-binding protein